MKLHPNFSLPPTRTVGNKGCLQQSSLWCMLLQSKLPNTERRFNIKFELQGINFQVLLSAFFLSFIYDEF